MRVVITDNTPDDYPTEHFLGDPHPLSHNMPKHIAKEMADKWNAQFSCESCPKFAKVVEENYELAPPFEP